MEARKLEAVLEGIRHAQNIMELVAGGEKYRFDIEDGELRKMYLELNSMCIALGKRIGISEAEEKRENGKED